MAILRPKCTLCPLGRRPNIRLVPYDGAQRTRILFVGEAPGENEDIEGRPFIGRSGDRLSDLLAVIGMGRDEVGITNICLCRPPDNRTPTAHEITTCTENYLQSSLARLQRLKLVVTLGKTASEYFIGPINMFKGTGKVYRINAGVLVYPMLHPSAVRSTERGDQWYDDVARLRRLLWRGYFGFKEIRWR